MEDVEVPPNIHFDDFLVVRYLDITVWKTCKYTFSSLVRQFKRLLYEELPENDFRNRCGNMLHEIIDLNGYYQNGYYPNPMPSHMIYKILMDYTYECQFELLLGFRMIEKHNTEYVANLFIRKGANTTKEITVIWRNNFITISCPRRYTSNLVKLLIEADF